MPRKKKAATVEMPTFGKTDVQARIRALLAQWITIQRGGKRADRVRTMRLHRGRGSSLKKLNRAIRTQLGLRPERYMEATEADACKRIWAEIQTLQHGVAV